MPSDSIVDTKANNTSTADDPHDVAQRGYKELMKCEHRVYGSTKAKLMVGVGQVLPNECYKNFYRKR